MKPLNSGTESTCSTPPSLYSHDPTEVLKSSMPVPTRWNRMITRSSRSVSSRATTITTWMTTAAMVRKSLRARAASVGYQRRAPMSTASSAPPKTQAHASLATKTTSSASHARGPASGTFARMRWAKSSKPCSTSVNLATHRSLLRCPLLIGRDARLARDPEPPGELLRAAGP